jgi:hypothetical protein
VSRNVAHSPRGTTRALAATALLCALAGPLARCGATTLGPPAAIPAVVNFRAQQPHPAVARIVVPEGAMTSYGSGTLVDVRDQFGLVITNWHVVRDGTGDVEVVFPDGFRSKARPLKVDADWDLAALVIWRPAAAPVRIAAHAPQSGDELTICGYGTGQYRAATGRCTKYYAPKVELPQHMVELDVEARQGDSGGPIFNNRGELAGVLFGAGSGTTLGSFGGRVQSFLASLAPDIGRAPDVVPRPQAALAQSDIEPREARLTPVRAAAMGPWSDHQATPASAMGDPDTTLAAALHDVEWTTAVGERPAPGVAAATGTSWLDQAKTVLAIIGVASIAIFALRAAG